MVEGGQDLPLVAEAAQDELRVHPAADELDGDFAAVLVVGPRRQVHGAHPAAPQLADDFVRPDPPLRLARGLNARGSRRLELSGEEGGEGRGLAPE